MSRQTSNNRLIIVALVAAAVMSLVFLHFFNPSSLHWFPRCPFLVLTGYKCPGCGTLRGIHFLLNGNFREAWQMNPLMIISIPLLAALVVSRRLVRSVVLSYVILAVVLAYWILRNCVLSV